jgi:hypothetical protein
MTLISWEQRMSLYRPAFAIEINSEISHFTKSRIALAHYLFTIFFNRAGLVRSSSSFNHSVK